MLLFLPLALMTQTTATSQGESGAILAAVIGASVLVLIGFLQVAYMLGKLSAQVQRNTAWIDRHDAWHSATEGVHMSRHGRVDGLE